MKIIFMGTPDFAVSPLEALIQAGHEVTAVVTQPDKPKGRSGKMQFPPVKECALKYDIPVLQPLKIRAPEAVAELKKYEADIFVVAAFGQILSKEILELPKFGCVNIHASLLPRYRGSSPVNWCIINGEQETGVTVMQMNEGIDTGDIYAKKSVPVDIKETAGSLFEKLARAGAQLIVEMLPKLEKGEIAPVKQDDSLACYVKVMDKSLGKIDWSKDAVFIERLVRGLNPWPGTYTTVNGKNLKIWSSDVVEADDINTDNPGIIVRVTKDYFDVACGRGMLRISELQLEGKKRMDTKSFLLGNPWKAGMRLG